MALSPLIESFQSSFLKALPNWVQIISGDFHVFGIFMRYSKVIVMRGVDFYAGDTKLKRFLPKNQLSQRKLLSFENWYSVSYPKVLKFDFQSQLPMTKLCLCW